jgi:hypothetical protein
MNDFEDFYYEEDCYEEKKVIEMNEMEKKANKILENREDKRPTDDFMLAFFISVLITPFIFMVFLLLSYISSKFNFNFEFIFNGKNAFLFSFIIFIIVFIFWKRILKKEVLEFEKTLENDEEYWLAKDIMEKYNKKVEKEKAKITLEKELTKAKEISKMKDYIKNF